MEEQEELDYYRVAKAIDYINKNFSNHSSLEELANQVHLSPAHFQRLFTNWAGTSPKKFLKYTSLAYAKQQLILNNSSVADTTISTALSSTSRLHDLYVSIEGMTPGDYKNGGKNLLINYSFLPSKFGYLFIASTKKGICSLTFAETKEIGRLDLQLKFPNATFINKSDIHQQNAIKFFRDENRDLTRMKLHLKGTDFQLKVWQSLLTIPSGNLSTYGTLAKQIGHPKAYRAVGTAIGRNPVAYLIPCHRVIQSSGQLGGYLWGKTRKQMLIGWEGVRNSH